MATTLVKMRLVYRLIFFVMVAAVIIINEYLQKNNKESSLSSKWYKFWIKFTIGINRYSLKQTDYLFPHQEFFQTYDLLLQTNQNLETSFRCIGPADNQSCLYKNLYYTDKTFWMLTSKKIIFPLPEVRIGAFIMSPLQPSWRRFYSYTRLDEFVRNTINPMVIPNLTLYFHQPWLSNIGHALFDGLYPGYVALIRFPPKHLQPFRILLSTYREINNHSFSQDVYNRFAGLGVMNSSILEEMSVGRWFVFQELVMGSGRLCQRCLQPNLQLPGGIELDGSRLFRARMYKQHGLIPPAARQYHSAERRSLQRPLKAYIIENKRFTSQDRMEMYDAMDDINQYTDIHIDQTTENQTKLQWPLIYVSYISYSRLTIGDDGSLQFNATEIESKAFTNHSRMVTHLRLLQEIDIHIVGPGTGQMYQTFLSDGSVNINLGGLGYIKQNDTLIKYTAFMEQYMTAGTPYIKGLYYPINERPKGIKREIVTTLIRKAAQLIMDGFSIPVNPRDNLAPDGQLFTEMCALDKEFCRFVTERLETSVFSCINTWPEQIVHEYGPWSSKNAIDDDNNNVTCSYNRTLLAELRKKYQIKSHN